MKTYIILILTCCVYSASLADSTTVRRKERFMTLGMGAVVGCNSCQSTGKIGTLNLSTTYGVYLMKRWAFGIGTGYDRYEHWETMPIFALTSFDLLRGKKNKLFAQLGYGYSIARIDKSEKTYGYSGSRGGEVLNPSLGYKIDYGPIWISFTLGYKFQRVFSSFRYYNPAIDIFPGSMPSYSTTIETRMDMSRAVLGMTVGWK